ncbi:arylamine N-acetyltransferase [Paraburkholderia sp. CNPSo 3076]|uniref:arylamine N-acetyltransferase family protein n=1 Tax=Paraburkholderia sp. CNPSo 3076 TaxID=2940936 RepID=UPI002256FD7D|nr:arylamine N-acetyltransferase [Paraburkholderia sp. CNPSo 3076]MCX5541461.1 arylamine N-acetyltransferase [Paraburkholderia sp. CNPSo 3076]
MNSRSPCSTLSDPRAYLAQLGYDTPPPPTLDTLRALQERHVCRFPFENLSTLLRLPVPIDTQSLEHKIVHGGQGGYCYELNLLFLALLRALGFDARGVTGRVVMGTRETAWPPRTHLLILVTFEGHGDYIADVGFGRMVPSVPLRLVADEPQATPLECFSLVAGNGQYTLQAKISGIWRALYVFDLQRQEEIDFEIGNWYISTHPTSPLALQLIVARPGVGLRKSLINGAYAVHHIDGATERRQIDRAGELLELLEHEFGIRVPQYPALTSVLERLLCHSSQTGVRSP